MKAGVKLSNRQLSVRCCEGNVGCFAEGLRPIFGYDAVQGYVAAASFIPMIMVNGMIIICMSNITCLAEASTTYFSNKSWVGFS